MKKILLTIAAVIFTAGAVAAQDMSQATETYNNGAMALSMGDNTGALDLFKQALTMGEACGEDGVELVNNCKDIITKIELSIAKDLIKEEKYDEAVKQLEKAVSTAKEYGNAEVETEATELIPQVYMSEGGQKINAKDYAGAAAAYEKAVAINPTNGTALLRLGMAYGAIAGKAAEAEKAYLAAMQNGQEKTAVKQLSTMYVKTAAAKLKEKKYEEAIADALKSNEYLENATAMKIAGTAASQLKNNADAVMYLEKYIALSPNARDLNQMYYTVAALSQALGDNAKACGYYKKITGDAKFGPTAKQMIETLKCN